MTLNPLSSQHPITLESIKGQLDHWRQTRTKGNRVPKHLWDDAVTLAKHLDYKQIATELRISPHRLRQKIESQTLQTPSLSTPDFVEFPLSSFPILPHSQQSQTQGTLEFTRPDGTTLKASGLAHGHLHSLVKDFLGR